MSRFTAWNMEEARALLGAGSPDAVLRMLQAVQARFGHVPGEAVALVAEAAGVSRAEVHGVLTFYHDLRTEPPAGQVIRLCRAEACQAVGCEALIVEAARLGLAIESVYCLGNCALGPAALVDGVLLGHLDAARLAALAAGRAAEELQVVP